MQQQKTLGFKVIEQATTTYYLAPHRHTNEAVTHFHITITPPNTEPFTLSFTRKLYVETK